MRNAVCAVVLAIVGCDKPAAIVKDDATLADPPKNKVEVTVMADGYGRQTRGVQLEAGRPTMETFTLQPVDPRGTSLDHSANDHVKSPNP